MAAEGNLWQSTRPRLMKAGFFVQRIETTTGEGVPDVWVGWSDGYAWLELKAIPEWPVRSTTRVFGAKGLRKEQINWHIDASQKGVVAFIFVGVGVGYKRQTFLVPSVHAERFNDMTKAELSVWECFIDNLATTLRVEGTLKDKTAVVGKATPLPQQK